jgi:CRISPR-associated protein Cas1
VESPDDVELLSVPVSQVGRIVTFGAVGVSAGARSWAVKADVDIVFASRRGSYEASLVGAASGPRVSRIRRQVAASESGSPEALAIAIAIVDAKISKQVILLRRLCDPSTADTASTAVSSMEALARMLPDCSGTSEVMGLEGAAAAAYFPALGELMPPDLRFTTRSRQPPQDLVNSGLSFLYTVLLGECVTALYAAGLDPAFGLLHSDKDRRPSLALDLQEEFRPLIVDQVVAEAARQGRLRVEHARTEGGGVLLTKAGRAALLDGYERRMLRRTRGALPDFTGTWRRHLYRQAQRLAATIMNPTTPWTGLAWRP